MLMILNFPFKMAKSQLVVLTTKKNLNYSLLKNQELNIKQN
jgi:hypothetical protein